MKHILLFIHKNAALLLFQSCKGRNEHASSCCFFKRLFLNSEKKGQVFFPQCETLQHLLLVHKPAQTLLGEQTAGDLLKEWKPLGFLTLPHVCSAQNPKVSLHLLKRWEMSWYRKEAALLCWGPGSAAGGCLVGSTCRWLELLKLLAPFALPWRYRAGTHPGWNLSGHEKKRIK